MVQQSAQSARDQNQRGVGHLWRNYCQYIGNYLAVINSNNDVADLYQTIPFRSSATHDGFDINVAIRFLLKEDAYTSLNWVNK